MFIHNPSGSMDLFLRFIFQLTAWLAFNLLRINNIVRDGSAASGTTCRYKCMLVIAW